LQTAGWLLQVAKTWLSRRLQPSWLRLLTHHQVGSAAAAQVLASNQRAVQIPTKRVTGMHMIIHSALAVLQCAHLGLLYALLHGMLLNATHAAS
jgi:hypothetical protein